MGETLNENLIYVQANFEDGLSVCLIVPTDASEEKVLETIREAYIREKQRLIKEKTHKRKAWKSLKVSRV